MAKQQFPLEQLERAYEAMDKIRGELDVSKRSQMNAAKLIEMMRQQRASAMHANIIAASMGMTSEQAEASRRIGNITIDDFMKQLERIIRVRRRRLR
ncbi:MAG: hypothetical protein AAB853_01980 [Patescibacteria group bacterium]